MKCERCGGFGIDVSFSGGVTALEAWEYEGWKCLNCGHVTDPLILENRIARAPRRRPAPMRAADGAPGMARAAA